MEQTRRTLLLGALGAAGLPSLGSAASKMDKVGLGLELYSVRQELAKDLPGTLKAVAKMGYQGVEFFGPYADWKVDYAKEVRKMSDDLGIKCYSAHTGAKYFSSEHLDRVVELNTILGSRFMIMSSAGRVEGLDGWKGVAAKLNTAAAKLKRLGKGTGYHNHALEFKPLEGKKPIEVLAAETTKDVVMQLDVGTCVEAGSDPVAWINANAGRIKSLHLKDWKSGMEKPHEGYRVLLGEGSSPWKEILAAAVKKGGVEHFLVEQEGSAFPELETAAKCLANLKGMLKG